MRHDHIPTLAVLIFLTNLSWGFLYSAFLSSLRQDFMNIILFSLASSVLLLSVILAFYLIAGGYPISRHQIQDALGKLRG